MTLPMIINDKSITVLFPSGIKTLSSDHKNFSAAKKALAANASVDALEKLFDVASALAKWTKGHYRITDEGVFYKEERLPALIESKVLTFLEEGLPFEPLLNFHNRLLANPSRRAMEELYRFLSNSNIPIDADGYFIGYKAIRKDWRDIHSGRYLNTIGAVIEMPRNQVDDNPNHTCSHGLHVGALEYVTKYFGGSMSEKRVVLVRVDPADVVSVPVDYNGQKLRCCKYTVIAEYTGPLPDTLYGDLPDSSEDDEDDFWGDEDEPLTCPNCDTEVEAGWQFCPECGEELF